jgi:dTDP-4-amino-4,6-dideoxygalactose transaminase
VHRLSAYDALGYREGDFPVAERIASQVLSLPMFPELLPEQQHAVAKAVQSHIG